MTIGGKTRGGHSADVAEAEDGNLHVDLRFGTKGADGIPQDERRDRPEIHPVFQEHRLGQGACSLARGRLSILLVRRRGCAACCLVSAWSPQAARVAIPSAVLGQRRPAAN